MISKFYISFENKINSGSLSNRIEIDKDVTSNIEVDT